MKKVLFAAFHIYRYLDMFDLYIVYILIGAKVNHTSLKKW